MSNKSGKLNVVLAGIMGRYPYGGVAWCSMMYLLGLRKLGHDVWYLEDTGECNYDPVNKVIATQPTYALDFIRKCLHPVGMGERWCYIDYTAKHHGMSSERWRDVCSDADLFLNLSGGCWFWRDEYAAIPHSAFIDTDPAFTQLSIAKGVPWYVEFFGRFGALFTFGRNIGTAARAVPTGPFQWAHTWQPVCTDQWRPAGRPRQRRFSTIMTWQIESFGDIGGNKNQEFARVIDLPSLVDAEFEIALSCPGEAEPHHRLLRSHGWRTRDGFEVSHDPTVYRQYIESSLGEFSVAKQTYVRTNSGWFSDRTECYLASGRPAVVQDTGFSAHLPTGEGLFAYHDLDGARAGIEAVLSDCDRHSRAAREIAVAHFSPEAVLPELLEYATARKSGGSARLVPAAPAHSPAAWTGKGVT